MPSLSSPRTWDYILPGVNDFIEGNLHLPLKYKCKVKSLTLDGTIKQTKSKTAKAINKEACVQPHLDM